MGRYIDLDKCGQYRTNHGGYPDTFAFPPWAEFEDVAPVIHAYWTYDIDDLSPMDSMMICSNCGEYEHIYANGNYCGNCGAKMDEEVDA